MHGCSYSLHTSSYDSAARSHVRFFEFLHQLEWDFLLMEEFLNHAVSGLVEGFIHGEHGERGSGGALECPSIVTDIQQQAADLLRRDGYTGLMEQLFCIGSRQLEGKTKCQRGSFSFDQFKTEGTDLLPVSQRTVIDLFLLLAGIISFLKLPIHMKGTKRSNTSFQKKEPVKGFT